MVLVLSAMELVCTDSNDSLFMTTDDNGCMCSIFTCEISGSQGGEYEVQSSAIFCRVVKQMSTNVSEVRAASTIRANIALMMEVARTPETSVDIC
jgi:hypothetical protein